MKLLQGCGGRAFKRKPWQLQGAAEDVWPWLNSFSTVLSTGTSLRQSNRCLSQRVLELINR